MAQLNISDSWWVDLRRFKLADKTGSRRLADGLMLEAWRLSQQFWSNKRKKFPLHVFQEIDGFQMIFDCDLAVKRGRFVYVRGTRQFHEWLALAKESGAKGGKTHKKPSKGFATQPEGFANLTLTPTLTPTLTTNNTNTGARENSKYKKQTPPSKEEVQQLIIEWQTTLDNYGIRRAASSDEAKLAAVAKRVGLGDALLMLRGYRFERAGADYDPAQNVTLSRLDRESSRERLRNLGATMVPVNYKLASE